MILEIGYRSTVAQFHNGKEMETNASISIVRGIMAEFAGLIGLCEAGKAQRRYLWTDAFAVCNYLELHRQTDEEKYKHLALRLVDQVHHILGRHREDDSRTAWINGLNAQEGKMHPTIGGLPIGKTMIERKPTDLYDERMEFRHIVLKMIFCFL